MGLTGNDKCEKMSMSANDLKNQGNLLFASRKFSEAIGCYTKAIIHNPDDPTYYTNRALCHLKLKHWQQAHQDSARALEINPLLVKGHFFLGQALLELKLYDEAIASLTRAYELSKEQKQNFGDDITGVIRTAKKQKWQIAEEKRIHEEIELQTELNSLLLAEKNRHIESLKRLRPDDDCRKEMEALEQQCNAKLTAVNNLFAQVDERRQKRDVPDVLCSRIHYGIMRDPVVTPSGITYERKDIEEHLQKLGHFDPVTMKELTRDQLVPNLALKEVIDNFLAENPWAEEY